MEINVSLIVAVLPSVHQSLIFINRDLKIPEIGVRVTGSAMFFSFCGDVIDLTR